MKFYTVEQIGPKRYKTPEGFLVCVGVPIARIGVQVYGPGENPIPPGPDGLIHVARTEAEVFRPQTIASANGKDVVNEHPENEDVMPHNYRTLTCGCMIDPRRGEGEEADLLLADLVIKEPRAIADVDAGKREVSLGYDADYVKTGEGRGEQRNIIVNHVALVDRGRCGLRCSIGDHQPNPEPIPVPDPECGCKTKETNVKSTTLDKLRSLLKGKVRDEDMPAIESAIDKARDNEGGEGESHIHLHMGPAGEKVSDKAYCTKDEFDAHVKANADDHAKIRDEMKAMMEGAKKEPPKEAGEEEADKEAAEEAPEGKKEEATKARDSAYLEESFNDTLASADVLVPGIKPPMTYDRSAKPSKTFRDGICGLRRTTLDTAYNTQPAIRAFIDQQLAGRPFNIRDDKVFPCRRVTDMFRGAVALKKALNNGTVGDVSLANKNDGGGGFGSTEVISASTLADQAASAWKN